MGGNMENEDLIKKLNQAIVERDAAIADIKRAWICAACKKRKEGQEWLMCRHRNFIEQQDGCLTCDNFEWRGVAM